MARRTPSILASALIAAAAAQSTTTSATGPSGSVTSIFLPFADQQPLVASILGGNAATTTFEIQCAPGTDSDECGFPSPITITAGPSTMHLQPSGFYNAVGEIDCKIMGNTEADCTATTPLYATTGTPQDIDVATATPTAFSTTSGPLTETEFSSNLISITITAGAVSGNSASSATGSQSGSGSETASKTGTSASSSGAAASATGNAAAGLAYSGGAAGMIALGVLVL